MKFVLPRPLQLLLAPLEHACGPFVAPSRRPSPRHATGRLASMHRVLLLYITGRRSLRSCAEAPRAARPWATSRASPGPEKYPVVCATDRPEVTGNIVSCWPCRTSVQPARRGPEW